MMMWGFIKRSGLRKIVKVDEMINSQKYCQILQENLLPYINDENIFQQDGAACHTSTFTKKNGSKITKLQF